MYREPNLQADVQSKQLYLHQDTRIDPIANIQTTNMFPSLNDNELGLNQIRYVKRKESDNKFLELKSISKHTFYLTIR